MNLLLAISLILYAVLLQVCVSVDYLDKCKEWASRKVSAATNETRCVTEAKLMWAICRHSCAKYARDVNPHCAQWASQGECRRNPVYMNVYCAPSCGMSISWNPSLRSELGIELQVETLDTLLSRQRLCEDPADLMQVAGIWHNRFERFMLGDHESLIALDLSMFDASLSSLQDVAKMALYSMRLYHIVATRIDHNKAKLNSVCHNLETTIALRLQWVESNATSVDAKELFRRLPRWLYFVRDTQRKTEDCLKALQQSVPPLMNKAEVPESTNGGICSGLHLEDVLGHQFHQICETNTLTNLANWASNRVTPILQGEPLLNPRRESARKKAQEDATNQRYHYLTPNPLGQNSPCTKYRPLPMMIPAQVRQFVERDGMYRVVLPSSSFTVETAQTKKGEGSQYLLPLLGYTVSASRQIPEEVFRTVSETLAEGYRLFDLAYFSNVVDGTHPSGRAAQPDQYVGSIEDTMDFVIGDLFAQYLSPDYQQAQQAEWNAFHHSSSHMNAPMEFQALERSDLFIVLHLSVESIPTSLTMSLPVLINRIRKWLTQRLQQLQLSYADLLVVHFPDFGGTVRGDLQEQQIFIQDMGKMWQALQPFVRQGLIRSLGIANFPASTMLADRWFDSLRSDSNAVQIHKPVIYYLSSFHLYAMQDSATLVRSVNQAPTSTNDKYKPIWEYMRQQHGLHVMGSTSSATSSSLSTPSSSSISSSTTLQSAQDPILWALTQQHNALIARQLAAVRKRMQRIQQRQNGQRENATASTTPGTNAANSASPRRSSPATAKLVHKLYGHDTAPSSRPHKTSHQRQQQHHASADVTHPQPVLPPGTQDAPLHLDTVENIEQDVDVTIDATGDAVQGDPITTSLPYGSDMNFGTDPLSGLVADDTFYMMSPSQLLTLYYLHKDVTVLVEVSPAVSLQGGSSSGSSARSSAQGRSMGSPLSAENLGGDATSRQHQQLLRFLSEQMIVAAEYLMHFEDVTEDGPGQKESSRKEQPTTKKTTKKKKNQQQQLSGRSRYVDVGGIAVRTVRILDSVHHLAALSASTQTTVANTAVTPLSYQNFDDYQAYQKLDGGNGYHQKKKGAAAQLRMPAGADGDALYDDDEYDAVGGDAYYYDDYDEDGYFGEGGGGIVPGEDGGEDDYYMTEEEELYADLYYGM